MFYAPTPRCYNGCGNAGGKNDDFIWKTHPQAISGPGFIRKNTTADLSHATWLGERTKAMGPVWLQPYDTAHTATMPSADCWGCLVPLTEPLCTAHPSPFCPQGGHCYLPGISPRKGRSSKPAEIRSRDAMNRGGSTYMHRARAVLYPLRVGSSPSLCSTPVIVILHLVFRWF